MSAAGETRSGWRSTNYLLAGVLALCLVALLVLAIAGVRALPGTSPANRAEQRYQAAAGAARSGMDAFLSVDYKNMDAIQNRLLKLSTGSFKSQYAAARVNITASAQAARVVATPTIRQVGISQLSADKATAVVAADLVRKNVSTTKVKATKACPHDGASCLYFRFTVQLTDTPDGWKLSDVVPIS